jgi:hypothetical protein
MSWSSKRWPSRSEKVHQSIDGALTHSPTVDRWPWESACEGSDQITAPVKNVQLEYIEEYRVEQIENSPKQVNIGLQNENLNF